MEAKEAHAVSLKVLRLSRPTLAQQQPLPASQILNPHAALSFPKASVDDSFALSPLLTLPTSFGSAFVGEGFDCILSVNNELPDSTERRITSAKVAAEMQTPSHAIPLDPNPTNEEAVKNGISFQESIQTVVHFDLREEGSHTLCVSVSYNESILSKEENVASAGRVRSFRKLYNFLVGPCLSVRTKATELSLSEDDPKNNLDQFALECQLENLADGMITIEKLVFEARTPFTSRSMNWDSGHVDVPRMAPREISQVAFLLEEQLGEKSQGAKKEVTKDGRTILGVLTIHWRSAMGHLGVLSTGWLTSRRR